MGPLWGPGPGWYCPRGSLEGCDGLSNDLGGAFASLEARDWAVRTGAQSKKSLTGPVLTYAAYERGIYCALMVSNANATVGMLKEVQSANRNQRSLHRHWSCCIVSWSECAAEVGQTKRMLAA